MHPTYYRGCWHVVSRCLFFRYRQQTMVLTRSFSSLTKAVYNPKAFILHAAWLDQGCPHCPKFPTAASRRSLGRVSVPVWLRPATDRRLGEPLPHQLANRASAAPIARGLAIPRFHPQVSCGISHPFEQLSPTTGHVPMYYSPVRHSPPGSKLPVLPFDLHV